MRIYILPAALTAITLIFSQCSQFGIELEMGKKELSLPLSVEQLGKTVAKDLHNTVINLHKMGVDYSDADASETFYDQFMADYLAANPIAVKTKGHVDFSEITDSKAFMNDKFQIIGETLFRNGELGVYSYLPMSDGLLVSPQLNNNHNSILNYKNIITFK